MYIDKFREGSITALDSLKEGIQPESVKDEIKALITEKFSTNNVIDGKGIEKSWLEYNYMHFPQIASTTKLTLMQENAQNIVARLVAAIRGETLTEITKANKQTAFAQGVDVFFTGQKLDGKVDQSLQNQTQSLQNQTEILPKVHFNLCLSVIHQSKTVAF